ncbi:MAG: VOC family protein [Actinobacteria bacterium]|nr:VOC family protein [Actinomycetota bacterium]
MNLNHLNLRVRDAAVCRDFYMQHFGFAPAFEADGGFFIRNAAGFLLALIPVEHHEPLPDGFHIGFAVGSGDAVLAQRDALSSTGVRVSDPHDGRPDDDYVSFRCWDPDGTEIELFWEPT